MADKFGFFIRKSEDTGQSIGQIMPLLKVVVTLVSSGDRILAVYNDKWGAFTLPMSKRRIWKDASGQEQTEEWFDAAIRAGAEAFGRTMIGKPKFLVDVAEFQQSDRDDKWKRYQLQAFQIVVEENAPLPHARSAEWLTADELLDEERHPISPTARYIVSELRVAGII